MSIKAAGMAEAAKIVGVTKSNFTSHRKKFDGDDQCPQPTTQLAAGPVWIGPDVTKLERWAKEFAKIRVTRAPRGSRQAAENREARKAATKTAPAPAKVAATKKAAPVAVKAPAAKVTPIGKRLNGSKPATGKPGVKPQGKAKVKGLFKA